MRADDTRGSVLNRLDAERGIALIAALMIMLLMSALMIAFTTVVMSDQRFRGIDKDRSQSYYAAQSGLEKLTVDLGNLFLDNVAPTNAQVANLANNPPAIPGVTFVAPAGITAYGATLQVCQPPAQTACSATIQNGPYQGLIALKQVYQLDAVAKTTSGGETHLLRKIESVAIPVFQFGTFSDVDLSFFAGPNFNFGGRVHTNGNLYLAEGGGNTLTLTDKVTAVKDVIRQQLSNGVAITTPATHDGPIAMATAPNTFRNLQASEGSVTAGLGSAANVNWPTVSLTTYNGYIRNGATGAKALNLPLITMGGANTDLVRRPLVNEDMNNAVLYGERMYTKASLRILLSDTVADIMNLPNVDVAKQPISLANWTAAQGGAPPAGYTVDATHPPVALSPGNVTMQTSAATALNGDVTLNGAPPAAWPSFHQASMAVFVAGLQTQTITCKTIFNALQFKNCYAVAPVGGALLAIPNGATLTMTVNGVAVNTVVTALVAAGANKTISVTNTAGFAAYNTFWLSDTLVTCRWVDQTTANFTFMNCSGTPVTNPAAFPPGATISTNALSALGTGLLDGFIKIERQDPALAWHDVTLEILNYGIAAPNTSNGCLGNTNAILWLERVKDTGAGFAGCPYTGSQDPFDYWPNALFDAREGIQRDVVPGGGLLRLGGVMHFAALNVGNLKLWLAGQGAYAAGTGANSFSNNGYGVYFSDRRNNRNAANKETGEYGFEDVVNPASNIGTPNGALDVGEDVNANGVLDIYGQFPNSGGIANTLPAGGTNPYNAAANVTPTAAVTYPQAMVNRTYLFRRALKLVNGSLGNIPTPGLMVISENPLYVQGDWNANQAGYGAQQAASCVIGDAVTLLSNNWTDWTSFVNPYSANARGRAAQSWYRLGIIAGKGMSFPLPNSGNTASDFGTDGGAHNFLRMLEGNGGTVNYQGAVATFYFSRQATGTYKGGVSNTVYEPPTRNFQFDLTFLNPATLCPLTPVFRDINALGFTQEIRPGK